MADVDTQKILDALKNVAQDSTLRNLKLGGGSGVDSSKKATEEANKAASSFSAASKSAAGDILEFTTNVAGGGARMSDVFATTSTIMDKLPLGSFLSGMSDGAKAAFKLAEGGVDAWRSLSEYGAGFNNSIMDMQNSAAQSRLTLDQFAGMVQNNSEALAGMGGSVTKGAQLFSKASKDMFDAGAADTLLQMGMSFEEVNEQLMTNMEFNRRLIAAEKMSTDEAILRTEKLAKEMDAIAKLTGQNRKEMEAEVNSRMRKGQVEAKIRQLEMSGNTEAAEKMRMALAEASKAGPGALAAVEDLFTKGAVVSEEGRQAAIALGPAFNNLQEMVSSVSNQGVSVDQMGASIDSFNTAIAERVNDPDFLNLATLGGMGNQFADAASSLVQSAGKYADGVEAIRLEMEKEAKGRKITTEMAIEESKRRVKQEQDPGVKTDAATAAVISGETALKDMSATINQELIGENGTIRRLSRALEVPIAQLDSLSRADMDAKFKSTFREIDTGLSALAGTEGPPPMERDIATQTATEGQIADLVKSIEAIPGAIREGNSEEAAKAGQLMAKALTDEFSIPFLERIDQLIGGNAPVAQKVADLVKAGNKEDIAAAFEEVLLMQGVSKESIEQRKQTGELQGDLGQMIDDALSEAGRIKTAPSFQDGTLGVFGSMFKDFGSETIAKLHGEEAVITPEQLENMAKGMQGVTASVSEGMSKNISSAMQNVKTPQTQSAIDTSSLEQAISALSAKIDQMSAAGSQSGNKEMSEALNNSLRELTSLSARQVNVAEKQLKAQKGFSGNVFKGL